MNQVLLLLGGLLIGALSAAIGAHVAAASMSIVGTLCMVVLYVFDPKARIYGKDCDGVMELGDCYSELLSRRFV